MEFLTYFIDAFEDNGSLLIGPIGVRLYLHGEKAPICTTSKERKLPGGSAYRQMTPPPLREKNTPIETPRM